METSPPPVETATPEALIWQRRADGLFIQIPAAPREQVLSKADRAVFRLFMPFAIISIATGFGYSEGMPLAAALAGLLISLVLAALLWRAYLARTALIRIAHLPTTIEISKGFLSIDAPHTAVQWSVPMKSVRDLTACVSEFEGFEVGMHSMKINKGHSIRLSLELDTNEARDVMIKGTLDEGQTLQLETDLREALGLAPLKPP
ncbi:MAG TPA: hypothetical protein VGP99_01255 [Tepidisphaeraceae bacterium]|jgi:hypothetical protein|nr:hypothetical protein [Tepidisphaeraceae bacterium]